MNKMVVGLYNKTGLFLLALTFSVIAIADSPASGVLPETYKISDTPGFRQPEQFLSDTEPDLNTSSLTFRPLTPLRLMIQLPGTPPEKSSPPPETSGGKGDKAPDDEVVKSKPKAAAKPDIPEKSQCTLPSDQLFTRISRMQYRLGDSSYYISRSFLPLPYAQKDNLLLSLHPEEALQIISTLIAGADPIAFIRATLPGIESPENLAHSALIHMLEVYDDALQYFHNDFGHHPGLASAGAIPNIAAMTLDRRGKLSDEGHERYIDFALVEDAIPQGEIGSPEYRIADTAMYYFVRRLRALLAEEPVAEMHMSFRQASYTPRTAGSRIPIDSIDSEAREVIRTFNSFFKRYFQGRFGRTYHPIKSRTGNDGIRYLNIAAVPSELLGLNLEAALFYLFSMTHKVKSMNDLLDNLARFAVFFNLVRPFSFCNETTLSNILNMVVMLASDPVQTGGNDAFVFPEKKALQTFRYDEMRALLASSLTIMIDRGDRLISGIETMTIIEQQTDDYTTLYDNDDAVTVPPRPGSAPY